MVLVQRLASAPGGSSGAASPSSHPVQYMNLSPRGPQRHTEHTGRQQHTGHHIHAATHGLHSPREHPQQNQHAHAGHVHSPRDDLHRAKQLQHSGQELHSGLAYPGRSLNHADHPHHTKQAHHAEHPNHTKRAHPLGQQSHATYSPRRLVSPLSSPLTHPTTMPGSMMETNSDLKSMHEALSKQGPMSASSPTLGLKPIGSSFKSTPVQAPVRMSSGILSPQAPVVRTNVLQPVNAGSGILQSPSLMQVNAGSRQNCSGSESLSSGKIGMHVTSSGMNLGTGGMQQTAGRMQQTFGSTNVSANGMQQSTSFMQLTPNSRQNCSGIHDVSEDPKTYAMEKPRVHVIEKPRVHVIERHHRVENSEEVQALVNKIAEVEQKMAMERASREANESRLVMELEAERRAREDFENRLRNLENDHMSSFRTVPTQAIMAAAQTPTPVPIPMLSEPTMIPVTAPWPGHGVLSELAAIETNGNVKIDLQTGLVEIFRPIMFHFLRSQGMNALSHFRNPEEAHIICADIANAARLLNCPIHVNGPSRRCARLVAEKISHHGIDAENITVIGKTGRVRVDDSPAIVHFQLRHTH
eukprot:TRINITY_DN44824_c0_g1_i1.p1 TRINITY_DN44824_c0_g1~~TRINITY_DN44824_c0_g1_i1.p1  ORF type:complete len:604 (-),score=67.16 TRINITY_DN44824_c0_g1_i1:162-1910(-)